MCSRKNGSSQSQTKNGSSKNPRNSSNQQSRRVGPTAYVLQINIEGASQPKCEYLSRLAIENHVDVIVVQEHHINDSQRFNTRGSIPGYKLLAYTLSPKYGSAVYTKSSLTEAKVMDINQENDLEIITVQVAGTTLTAVYKPPSINFPNPPLPKHDHPAIYLGDFNSHHTSWGYHATDKNGKTLSDWAESESLHLIFDAKDRGSFHSARWKSETNPDLCFVSEDQNGHTLPATRKILGNFPRSQHRPALIKIGLEIPMVNSIPKVRWNFNKADWEAYSTQTDSVLRWIKPTVANYGRFCNALIATAKRHIPRGFRRDYVPGWSTKAEEAYQDFLKTSDPQSAHNLLTALDESRRQKWMNCVESMDFTHTSKKSWSLLRKLGGASAPIAKEPSVHPEDIAKRLQMLTKSSNIDKSFARDIRQKLFHQMKKLPSGGTLGLPFSMQELTSALKYTRDNKAAGLDDIFPEFLTNLGKNGKKWLLTFYNEILETSQLPNIFLKAKIIAILKPGKPAQDVANYRPISLLCVTYKVLERLLYQRLNHLINPLIPAEQAGFRPHRSCSDQVLALTSYIEAGFQRGQKTFAAFVDLKAAYDTVWIQGLLYKLTAMIPCIKTISLIKNMLGPRSIKVVLGDKESGFRLMKNGIPQGSVLAPLLFNIYTSDLPCTTSEKFVYADDLALAYQGNLFNDGERALTKDLHALNDYYTKWRLTPNPSKSETSAFHLTNSLAQSELNVSFCGSVVKHNFYPRYLGVTLDRSLTFRVHLTSVAQKVKTRVNLVSSLAGTTWGARADVLRTSALALIYSTAEYCAPAWYRSAHTGKVDVELNRAMRIISGTLRPTPLPWLPVLSHIAPPKLRREQAAAKEMKKALQISPHPMPIRKTLDNVPTQRLPSRKPIWSDSRLHSELNLRDEWKTLWQDPSFETLIRISDPTHVQPGFTEHRKLWSTLNRIRTGVARCNYHLHKWGLADSASCDCGAAVQTVQHIVNECPLRKFPGGLDALHQLNRQAKTWLLNLDLKL